MDTLRECSFFNGVNGNSADAETQFTSRPVEAAVVELISGELMGKVEVLSQQLSVYKPNQLRIWSRDLVQAKRIGPVDRSEDSLVDAGDAADVRSPVPEGARSRRIREGAT